MSFYQGLAKTASNVLKQYGQLLTFTVETKSDFDPATGKFGAKSTQTYSVYGIVEDYTSKDAGLGTIQGTSIITGDKKVTIEASIYIPSIADDVTTSVTIDGAKYSLVNFTKESPAGIPVIYELQVRK